MRKQVFASICAVTVMVSGCGTTDTTSNQAAPATPETVEFNTTTELGIDVSEQLPPDNAWTCEERIIQTSSGAMTVKNFNIEGREATFWVAPSSNADNSYSYKLEFENGHVVMESIAAGSFNTYIQVFPSTEEEEVPIGLGSDYLTASFEVPAEYVGRLGKLESARAAINGELAGTCYP